MKKEPSRKPIDNLMLKSVDAIYKYGAFSIDYPQSKYRLYIDENSELCFEHIDINAKGIKKTIDIKNFLALLAYRTFFNKDQEIIDIVPEKINRTKKQRLKSANYMYDIYEAILLKNPDKIREVITTGTAQVFFEMAKSAKKNKYAFEDIEALKYDLEMMTAEYSEDLVYGLSLYNALNAASPKDLDSLKKEWEEFTSHTNLNYTEKRRVVKRETSEDIKLDLPYEIINERSFIVNPAVGRDSEIRDIGASLLSYAVNPVLLGEPGVGKTAVIEGIAYKINNGDISEKLKDKKIIKISPASIVSGCMYRGMFEERMQKLIEFLKENEDYILYIDEIHTAYGTGATSTSDNDMFNILKPYIENGDIKIIGATTTEEYEDIILQDKAFARRLRPVTIKEPFLEVLKMIVINNIAKYERICGVSFANTEEEKEMIVDILIDVTKEKNRSYKEKRYNPALILSIIEQAFGYASYDESTYVGVKYIIEALNRCENIYESVRTRACETLKNLQLVEKPKAKIIEFKQIKELN